ncbi:hypothetical protein H4R35_005657 [Dimargaris xerosporica]|nr:hypothetical protein H4R35_005657 [Dimargaris xerosporica]
MATPSPSWTLTLMTVGLGLYFGWRTLGKALSSYQSSPLHTDAKPPVTDSKDSSTSTSIPPEPKPTKDSLQPVVVALRDTLKDLVVLLTLSQKYGQHTTFDASIQAVVETLEAQVAKLDAYEQALSPDLQLVRERLDQYLVEWRRIRQDESEAQAVSYLMRRLTQLQDSVTTSDSWLHALGVHLEVLKKTMPSPSELGEALQKHTEKIKQTWEDTLASLVTTTLSGTFIETIRNQTHDTDVYPELHWDAEVRTGHDLPAAEVQFRERRLRHVCRAFARFIDVPEHEVTPENMPVIALGGSGGGYRAMVSSLGYFDACRDSGLLDCATYMAGVSGTCWALAQYYMVAECSMDALQRHLAHQITVSLTSLSALADVLTSPAAASVFSGLVRKFDSGTPLSLVDLYGTLLMSRLLTRTLDTNQPETNLCMSSQAQWIRSGDQPMPIYTAVRHEVLRQTGDTTKATDPEPDAQSAATSGQGWSDRLMSWSILPSATEDPKAEKDKSSPAPAAASTSLQGPSPDLSVIDPDDADCDQASVRSVDTLQSDQTIEFLSAIGLSKTHKYQWFEFTPFEIGTAEEGVWIPAWAFGRRFDHGRSQERLPEPSVGLYLGMFGSAFCATVGHMIDEVKGILATPVYQYLEGLVRDFRQAVTTTHPIAPSCFHNPFYRLDKVPDPPEPVSDAPPNAVANEAKGRSQYDPQVTSLYNSEQLCLMDAGMNNNLPFYPLLRPERGVDVILLFDASSDIDQTPWFARAEEFAKQQGIRRWPWGAAPWPSRPSSKRKAPEGSTPKASHGSAEGAAKPNAASSLGKQNTNSLVGKPSPFESGRRCAIFPNPCAPADGELPQFSNPKPADQSQATTTDPLPITLIYYPLLANPKYEEVDFDPATADFCSTYNFAYTPEQVDKLASLARLNFNQELDQLRSTLKQVWLKKKQQVETAGS